MRTPQAQIETASPSTVTTDDGTFFNGSHTETSEVTHEETSAEQQTQTEVETTSEIETQSENITGEQVDNSEFSEENLESLGLTVVNEDFMNDLESRSNNLPSEEQSSEIDQPDEAPRRAQRVPNDLDELRALQANPPDADQVADLNTDRLSGITESLGQLSPSEMGKSAPQFNSATRAATENEISAVENDLPVLEQPTGLEPGEEPLQQVAPTPLERSAEIEYNTDQGTVQTEITPTPEPEPARATSPILRPTNEQELERAMNGLEVDSHVNTNLGDPPTINLTGEADPTQADREEQRNNAILRDTELDEINSFRRDFGENDVYPSIPTEELSSSQELTPASDLPTLETEYAFPVLLESDEELVNRDILTELESERTQAINESQVASTEFDSERAIELENGLETIRNEERLATEEQIRVRENNADTIAGHREDHERETAEIIAEYEGEVDQQRQEHDSDLEEEFNTTMDEAESFFDEAEGEASEAQIRSEAQVARERREAEAAENERSWLDEAIDAVTDFFNDLIESVTRIIDDLRASVKRIFDAVKARVVSLIDSARDIIVGMIRSFGNLLIEISNRALARFPGLRDRVNGLINDSMNWAEQRVNQIAESLKTTVIAALDFIANAIDSLLEAYQIIIVAVLEFYKQFTIAVLEMAHYYYEYLINTILMIATLVAFTVIMQLGTIFLSTAWHFLGRETKERLVDAFLGVIIALFEAAPDEFDQGFLWPLYVNMQLGYFYEIYNWDMDTKIAYYDKLAGLLISPSFWWNFLLGIFQGIWDNIWGILEGIWMLIRFIFYDLWVMIDRVIDMLMDIAPDVVALIEQLNTDIRAFIQELKTTGKEKLEQLRNNLSRENIEKFFEGLEDDLKVRARVLGSRMANRAKEFMLRDDAYATIGFAVGRITGYLIVEILLAVFTAGIGTAIKWGLKGVKVAVRIAKMLGSVGRAGGFFSRIVRFFSKGVKWLIKAIMKFADKVASIARGLLQRFKTIFSNLSRRIDDIAARLSGRQPRPRPNVDVPNRPRPRTNAPDTPNARRPRTDGPDAPNRPRQPRADGPDAPNRPRRPRTDGPDTPDRRRRRDRDNDESRAQQEARWRRFKLSVSTALNPYRQSGMTDRAAYRLLRSRAAGFRSVVRLRNPVSSVTRDKGWYKLRVRKIGGIPDINAIAGEVPIIRRERWNLAKIAIRARLRHIRENQINQTGLRRILRPFKHDYKFSRLYPEWDQQESDWNIMGAMSRARQLHEVKDPEEIYNIFERRVNAKIRTLQNNRRLINGYSRNEVEEQIRAVTNRRGGVDWNKYSEIFRSRRMITVENVGTTHYRIMARLYKTSNRTRTIGQRIEQLPTGRTRNQPIDMVWFNARYSQIRHLRVRPAFEHNPRFWDSTYRPRQGVFAARPGSKTTLRIPKSQSTNPNANRAVTGRLTTQIGINAHNHITVGRVVQRTQSTPRRGSAVRSFRTLIFHYNRDLAGLGYQVDHVRDLGYGGNDNFGNLWPLTATKNQRTSNRMVGQRVHFQMNKTRIIGSPNPPRMFRKWFRIARVQTI